MEDYEIGIVKSYVNALDSFATVMPYIGQHISGFNGLGKLILYAR